MVLPTTTIAEASRRIWDVGVIGAGPAGSVTARELARLGRSVLLLDKAAFPRWKVCGACLSARALALLGRIGLGDLGIRCGGVPLHELELGATGRSARVALPSGLALSRSRFDAVLVEEAIAAGVAFLPQTRAGLGDIGPAERTILLHHGDTVGRTAVRIVVAADGLGGNVAGNRRIVQRGSRIGAGSIAWQSPAYYRPGVIYMACGKAGYVGLVLMENGRLDIAAALDLVPVRRQGLGDTAAAILKETGWPAIPQFSELRWRGTPVLTQRTFPLGGERLFVLGDAAGYIEPFTGEGMAWAMAGGVAAAPLVAEAVRGWRRSLVARWQDCYRHEVSRRQGVCRAAATILRRPVWSRLIIAVLGKAPWLAAPVTRYLNG